MILVCPCIWVMTCQILDATSPCLYGKIWTFPKLEISNFQHGTAGEGAIQKWKLEIYTSRLPLPPPPKWSCNLEIASSENAQVPGHSGRLAQLRWSAVLPMYSASCWFSTWKSSFFLLLQMDHCELIAVHHFGCDNPIFVHVKSFYSAVIFETEAQRPTWFAVQRLQCGAHICFKLFINCWCSSRVLMFSWATFLLLGPISVSSVAQGWVHD